MKNKLVKAPSATSQPAGQTSCAPQSGKPCLLSELERGETGMVCGVEHCGATGQRLLAMGLMPGCELKFLRNAPLGDPMMVETSTGVICLRRREAAMVQVERTK